jgi:hypothetical protein
MAKGGVEIAADFIYKRRMPVRPEAAEMIVQDEK